MNKVVVGILAGRGQTAEARQVMDHALNDAWVEDVLALFGHPPAHPESAPAHFVFPPAALNERGEARTALLRACAAKDPDVLVLLDDDTLPEADYYRVLALLQEAHDPRPLLMTGKLCNLDKTRCWDACSFQRGTPVVVPYEAWDHPDWAQDLYFSGPQHLLNKAGVFLAVQLGYPALRYGEDTHFCWSFKKAGGSLKLLHQLKARLLHQHTAPNYPQPFQLSELAKLGKRR